MIRAMDAWLKLLGKADWKCQTHGPMTGKSYCAGSALEAVHLQPRSVLGSSRLLRGRMGMLLCGCGGDLERAHSLTALIDSFFATRIFGTDRLAHFRRQSASLTGELRDRNGDKRKRIAGQLAEVEQKIERQLAAIEAGVSSMPSACGSRSTATAVKYD
jgi:hypothetical protein